MQPEWQCECGDLLGSGFDCIMHAKIYHPEWNDLTDEELRSRFTKLKEQEDEHQNI